MKSILISPYSRKLRSGKENPKNYPYWEDLIKEIRNKMNDKYKFIQIGVEGEQKINGIDEFLIDLSFNKLKDIVDDCDYWFSVDNFFPHFCAAYELKVGVVIFSKSDPRIFGYKHNINVIKDFKYLRPNQFAMWEEEKYDKQSFVKPNEFLRHINI
jgi:hypothetical protein